MQQTERLENNLIEFFAAAWPFIDPAPYMPNWHLDAIAAHLEAVSRGEIRKLLVNIPPRHAKTLLVGVAWPAWTWIQRSDPEFPLTGPQVKFLCLSYGDQLSIDTATTARRLVQSAWFQERWGHRVRLASDQEAKSKFDTTAGGSRISASFGGSVLGRGGDIRIIDDPHKVSEVESESVRRGVIQTYDETIKSRVTDPKHTAEVIIMHRVHEDDLAGHIITGKDEFVHLMLPAEFDPARKCSTVLGFEDPRQEDGELLWGDKWGPEELAPFKRVPYLWAGQYQQLPTPRGGGIIKDEWWQLWPSEAYPQCELIVGSLDTAYTEKKENDASALTVWGLFRDHDQNPKIVLLYAWEGRLQLHELVLLVGALCSSEKLSDKARGQILALLNKGTCPAEAVPQFPVDKLLIEAKASGISAAQELTRLYRFSGEFGVELLNPDKWGDKVARMYAVQHLFADEMIYAPDRAFAEMVINNVSAFPKAAHDDLADTVSQALNYLRRIGLLQRKEEYARDMREQLTLKSRERPLY